MYKNKISPEEALELIKVRMNYDTKKTLKENGGVVKEQKSTCPNSIDYSELRQLGEEAGNIVKKMDASFVRMGYGEERANELYDIVKNLVGKNVYDDISGECIDAIDQFKKSFKQTGSRGFFEGGFDLESKLRDFAKGYYSDEPEVLRFINATLNVLSKKSSPTTAKTQPITNQRQQNINNSYCSVKDGKITTGGKNNGVEWEKYKQTYKVTDAEIEIAKNSCPKSNSGATKRKTGGGMSKAPSELATVEGIKGFQDWLDTNHPGWATGYKDGVVNKGKNGGGYGSFGPRTSKAWASYKNDYLSGKTNKQDDEEVSVAGEGGVNEPID